MVMVEERVYARNSNVAAALIAQFPFERMRVGEAFFVPDKRTSSGKLTPVPVKAANHELAPARFRIRAEVNDQGVKGRYVYRVE